MRATRPGILRWGVAVALSLGSLGWMGAERDRAAEGNAHYDKGDFADAETAYGEGLIDYPESPRLRFNLGAAQYREGKYSEAIATLEKLLPSTDGNESTSSGALDAASELAPAAAYNLGNARFKLGQQAEAENPQEAVTQYEQALAAYKRSIALDSAPEDPKFNHEFVARRLAALKKKIEEESQSQESPPQDQPEQSPEDAESDPGESPEDQTDSSENTQEESQDGSQDDSQDESAQGQEEQAGDETPPQDQPREPEQQADSSSQPQEQAPAPEPEPAAGSPGDAGGQPPAGDELSPSDARALIDTARDEEVDPSEIQGRVGVTGLGVPAEDW